MTKNEFLLTLRDKLNVLSKEDIEKSIDYYNEIIDDRIEDGLTEDEAVEAIGSVDEVAAQILMDTPLSNLLKPKRALKVWELVLLIIGLPIWLPLLLTALSLYIVFWAVIASLYAVVLSPAVCGLAAILNFAILITFGNLAQGILFLGMGLVCIGLAILAFFGCNKITKGAVICGKKILMLIKSCFIRKGNSQ